MFTSKVKKIVTIACVILLQPMLYPGSLAFAKRRSPPKAFSFITEGGKASQGECDGERGKIPRLKRIPEYAKISTYMGSEIQSPELKGKIEGEMWKHFYKVKTSCNTALAKMPSAIEENNLKTIKTALPEEEAVDAADEAEKPEAPESEAPDAE